jgi:hypothetical protein
LENQLFSDNSRCEAVICLLSSDRESSPSPGRVPDSGNLGKHSELLADRRSDADVETIPVRGGPPVVFAKAGLDKLREPIRGAGAAAEKDSGVEFFERLLPAMRRPVQLAGWGLTEFLHRDPLGDQHPPRMARRLLSPPNR